MDYGVDLWLSRVELDQKTPDNPPSVESTNSLFGCFLINNAKKGMWMGEKPMNKCGEHCHL